MTMDTERPPEWLAKWMSEHPEEEALGLENIGEDDYIDLTKDNVDYSLMRVSRPAGNRPSTIISALGKPRATRPRRRV